MIKNISDNVSINVKDKVTISLSLKSSKVRIHEKTNNNGVVRKMKIYIELSKEESEGYKSFMKMVKPDQINEQDFIKMIFLKGVEAINIQLTEEAKKYMESHPEMFNVSGGPETNPNIEVL